MDHPNETAQSFGLEDATVSLRLLEELAPQLLLAIATAEDSKTLGALLEHARAAMQEAARMRYATLHAEQLGAPE